MMIARMKGTQYANDIGNAQVLKRIEMTENSLRENAKIVISENRISPMLFLGSLPANITTDAGPESRSPS